MIEESSAIKCPTVAVHLVGCKKIQQELAVPGALERFFPDEPNTVALLRSCFTGLYSLDPESADVATTIANAIAKPYEYLLKPQREGGGIEQPPLACASPCSGCSQSDML
jgi:glutathione synthase